MKLLRNSIALLLTLVLVICAFPTMAHAEVSFDYPDIGLTMIIGEDRYSTQLNVADVYAPPYGVRGLVVATGTNHADAVVGAGIAGALDYQFLYANPRSSERITNYIEQHNGAQNYERVVIVGGESAVPKKVENELRAVLPNVPIDRVWGMNRYETSRKVFEYGDSLGNTWGDTAIVVSGPSWADGASCAGLAAYLHAPVFFVDKTGALSQADRGTLSRFDEVLIIGGKLVVSEATESELSRSSKVTRIAGRDRYATNVQVALYELSLPDEDVSGGKAFSVMEPVESLFFVTGKTYADCIPLMVNSVHRNKDASIGTVDSRPRPVVLMQDPGHTSAVVEAFGLEARRSMGLEPIQPQYIVCVGFIYRQNYPEGYLFNKLHYENIIFPMETINT